MSNLLPSAGKTNKSRFQQFCQSVRRTGRRAMCALTESRLSLKRVPRPVGVGILLAAALLLISTAFLDTGLQVYADGTALGIVSSQDEFEEIVASVERRASEILGHPYRLDLDVEYKLEMYERGHFLDADAVAASLFGSIDEIEPLYTLSVDGTVVGANADRDAIAAAVESVVSEKAEGETPALSSELLSDVEITYGYVAAETAESIEEIQAQLSGNIRNEVAYTVQEGDLFSDIAASYGLSTEELQSLNPEIDPATLTEGDIIVVENAIPLMSVAVNRLDEYDETVPYETVEEYSNAMWAGESYVKTEGSDGILHHTDSVEYVDGVETSRTSLSVEPTVEVVDEVIVYGTRKFISPVKSVRAITSKFGWRTFRGGSDFHSGIDLANPSGTPIYASYEGTVISAGWKGNYGNCVIINHGYGYQTLYAHCKSLACSVGDKVSQGELIAYTGSTGRSTGPHCHFEIRVNGTAVNPYPYIFGK